MPKRTCFVIMPIGDQEYPGGRVSAQELKTRYDDLIKEAILRADPTLDVLRADEVAVPGTVTGDIITRLMHSDLVVADVTYPNPNVFYELGLRHACRVGTVIIRDKAGPKVPFDIAHMRYVEYDNTATGLKSMAHALAQYFDYFRTNPTAPDNQFQEYAKLTHYEFPDYGSDDEDDPETQAFLSLMQSPEVLQLLVRHASGEQISQEEVLRAMFSSPDIAQQVVRALAKSGQLSLGIQKAAIKKPSRRPKRK